MRRAERQILRTCGFPGSGDWVSAQKRIWHIFKTEAGIVG